MTAPLPTSLNMMRSLSHAGARVPARAVQFSAARLVSPVLNVAARRAVLRWSSLSPAFSAAAFLLLVAAVEAPAQFRAEEDEPARWALRRGGSPGSRRRALCSRLTQVALHLPKRLQNGKESEVLGLDPGPVTDVERRRVHRILCEFCASPHPKPHNESGISHNLLVRNH